MGAHLNADPAIKGAESNLSKLQDALTSDLAQAAVDVAGIVDPTPISDAIGAGMSLAKGDLIGAGLSLVSMIPYAGDALAKTAKGARLAKRLAHLRKAINAATANLNKAREAAKARAAASVRARRASDGAAKAAQKKVCKDCPEGTKPANPDANRFGSRLPKDGTWSGEKGNSAWTPDPSTPRGKEILDATGGKPIQFKDGYPDFSSYSQKTVSIDNMKGDYDMDFRAANMKAGFGDTKVNPEGMTWHHHEDGKTMMLVPQKINNNVPHTGGGSIVKDPGY